MSQFEIGPIVAATPFIRFNFRGYKMIKQLQIASAIVLMSISSFAIDDSMIEEGIQNQQTTLSSVRQSVGSTQVQNEMAKTERVESAIQLETEATLASINIAH